MKSIITVFGALILLISQSVLAQKTAWEVSGNVAIQSDYVWRGISQNLEDPSIQGGFDAAHDGGFYVGIWGASVDFGGVESTEFDVYGGWGKEFESGLGVDIGVIEYTYHGGDDASNSNFTEAYVGVNYAGFGAYYYAGDEFSDLIEITYSHDFESGFSVAATYGDYDEYNFYSAGISTEVGGIGLDLSYWDTDVDQDELAEGRVVFTISKEF